MSRADVENAGKKGATNQSPSKILDEFFLIVDPEEESLGRNLARDGFWEAWITSFFTSVVLPGDVVCDLGANYGYYTRLFEKLAGPSGFVYAVEANPNLSSILKKSIESFPLNGGAQVQVLGVAAMDKKGYVELNVGPLLGGSSIIGSPQDSKPILVSAAPLDEIISRKVDVIKIDIEGTEPQAILGMARIMDECRICVVEVGNYQPTEFLKSIFESYEVSVIDLFGNERPYSLPEVLMEQECVMVVLRHEKKKSKYLLGKLLPQKMSEIKFRFLKMVIKKFAKVISKANR